MIPGFTSTTDQFAHPAAHPFFCLTAGPYETNARRERYPPVLDKFPPKGTSSRPSLPLSQNYSYPSSTTTTTTQPHIPATSDRPLPNTLQYRGTHLPDRTRHNTTYHTHPISCPAATSHPPVRSQRPAPRAHPCPPTPPPRPPRQATMTRHDTPPTVLNPVSKLCGVLGVRSPSRLSPAAALQRMPVPVGW